MADYEILFHAPANNWIQYFAQSENENSQIENKFQIYSLETIN